LPSDEDQRRFFRLAVRATEVHTIHAEVEGRSKLSLFSQILDDWIAGGATFLALEDLARESLTRKEEIAARELTRTTLPGRAGTVATGWPGTGQPSR
jgi:hypothetical protein